MTSSPSSLRNSPNCGGRRSSTNSEGQRLLAMMAATDGLAFLVIAELRLASHLHTTRLGAFGPSPVRARINSRSNSASALGAAQEIALRAYPLYEEFRPEILAGVRRWTRPVSLISMHRGTCRTVTRLN